MIGLFGGTFDPVHYGHIKPVLAVKESLTLNQVRFIPNRQPPHRDQPWLSVEQRLSLLTEAIIDIPGFTIDTRELDRVGPSYMVDTLWSLKQEFVGESLVLIVGMDVLYSITSWHRWQDIFKFCHLVVTQRPGFQTTEISQHLDAPACAFIEDRLVESPADLSYDEGGKILLQSVPQVDVSATRIRELIQIDPLDTEQLCKMMPATVFRKLRGFLDDN